MNRLLSLLFAVLALGYASVSHAFPHLYMWVDPANGVPPNSVPGSAYTYPSGNVPIYGTGGASDWGVTCALCHTKAAGAVDAMVAPNPGWQLVNGSPGYKPGQQYAITVTLLNEQKGKATPSTNLNGFALTIENQNGQGVGVFANDSAVPITTSNCTNARILGANENNLITAGVTTYLISPNTAGGGCYTVVFVPKQNSTVWNFKWTAPPAGTGPVTIFYGVVDGDKGGTDSKGDDVKQGTIKLVEGP